MTFIFHVECGCLAALGFVTLPGDSDHLRLNMVGGCRSAVKCSFRDVLSLVGS